MKTKFLLGVIGAGNMATAIVKGALKTLKASDIIVSDRRLHDLRQYRGFVELQIFTVCRQTAGRSPRF